MHFSQHCSYFLHEHTQRDRQFVCVVDPNHVLWIINHIPQFTPSSWGRLWDIKRACDWLPAVFVCTKKSVVMRFQPLPGTAHSCNSSSLISSDVLLSDATIVFVLDIVLALIINCSNYSGPCPFSGNNAFFGKKKNIYPEKQEKLVHMLALTQRLTVTGSVGGTIKILNKWALYIFALHNALSELCATGRWSVDVLPTGRVTDCAPWTVGGYRITPAGHTVFYLQNYVFCFLPSTGNKHVEFQVLRAHWDIAIRIPVILHFLEHPEPCGN